MIGTTDPTRFLFCDGEQSNRIEFVATHMCSSLHDHLPPCVPRTGGLSAPRAGAPCQWRGSLRTRPVCARSGLWPGQTSSPRYSGIRGEGHGGRVRGVGSRSDPPSFPTEQIVALPLIPCPPFSCLPLVRTMTLDSLVPPPPFRLASALRSFSHPLFLQNL